MSLLLWSFLRSTKLAPSELLAGTIARNRPRAIGIYGIIVSAPVPCKRREAGRAREGGPTF